MTLMAERPALPDLEAGPLAEFRVNGRPRTKGSLRVYCTKGPGHKIHLEEEVVESKAWRKKVARVSRDHQKERYGTFLRYPDAVDIRLVFFFPREESVGGGPIPSHQTQWPTPITLGDADKLTRNVLDALIMPRKRTEAAVTSALILDDSQVVRLWVAKFWTLPETHAPGVQVLALPVESVEVELARAEAMMGGWLS